MRGKKKGNDSISSSITLESKNPIHMQKKKKSSHCTKLREKYLFESSIPITNFFL